jgi:hypothetical protein
MICKQQDRNQDLVEKALISNLDVLMQERLQLVNVDPKQCGVKWATPFDPYGAPDEI